MQTTQHFRRISVLVTIVMAAIGACSCFRHHRSENSSAPNREARMRGLAVQTEPISRRDLEGMNLRRDVMRRMSEAAAQRASSEAEQKARDTEPGERELSITPERSLVEITREAIRNAAIEDFPFAEIPKVVDDILSEQAEDAVWSAELTEALNGLTRVAADDTMSIKHAKCYETMCKIVSTHATEQDVDSFWDEAMNDPAIAGPGRRYSRRIDESTFESIQYLGRYGKDTDVHDAVYNRMFEIVTSTKYENIAPTAEQMSRVEAQIRHSPS